MKGLMTRVLLVAGILLAMPALAQTWEPVIGADKLRAVFSDTEMEAALEGGQKMTALYRSDGTGEVTAWGDTFERQWRIDGNELICIKMSSRYECFRLEKTPIKTTNTVALTWRRVKP